MYLNLRLCIIRAVWELSGESSRLCALPVWFIPASWSHGSFGRSHISACHSDVTVSLPSEQSTSSGMRSQEEISAQLTGNPSYTDSMEGDCAKFCCLQRNSQGLQEGFRLTRLQASHPNAPTPKVCEWKRETENEISWTICKIQKRSWPNIFPYGLDHFLSDGSSPERC